MTDVIKITADRVISTGKGKVKFYADDGSIVAEPRKSVKIYDTQEAMDADVLSVTDSRRDFEAEDDAEHAATAAQEETTEQAGTDDAQAAAPARSTKRGKGKGKEQMATKAKKSAKKAAKKTSNGVTVRVVAGREHDISNYEKSTSAGGHTSYDNGDDLAAKLRGKTLDEVYAYAAKTLKVDEKTLRAQYKKLNPGMQRMNLGNRLRKALKPKAA